VKQELNWLFCSWLEYYYIAVGGAFLHLFTFGVQVSHSKSNALLVLPDPIVRFWFLCLKVRLESGSLQIFLPTTDSILLPLLKRFGPDWIGEKAFVQETLRLHLRFMSIWFVWTSWHLLLSREDSEQSILQRNQDRPYGDYSLKVTTLSRTEPAMTLAWSGWMFQITGCIVQPFFWKKKDFPHLLHSTAILLFLHAGHEKNSLTRNISDRRIGRWIWSTWLLYCTRRNVGIVRMASPCVVCTTYDYLFPHRDLYLLEQSFRWNNRSRREFGGCMCMIGEG
jgi:hypothetical protein